MITWHAIYTAALAYIGPTALATSTPEQLWITRAAAGHEFSRRSTAPLTMHDDSIRSLFDNALPFHCASLRLDFHSGCGDCGLMHVLL